MRLDKTTREEVQRKKRRGPGTGLGNFPADFSIIVYGPEIALLLSKIFFFFSFLLFLKFTIAGLPALDNKHAFCGYLHLIQGKPRP